jgi:hypothetical protein
MDRSLQDGGFVTLSGQKFAKLPVAKRFRADGIGPCSSFSTSFSLQPLGFAAALSTCMTYLYARV